MDEELKFKHLLYTIEPPNDRKKRALLIIVVIVVIVLLVLAQILRKQSKITPSFEELEQGYLQRSEIAELQDEEIEEYVLRVGSWQSFDFLYPENFALTSGSFENDYFSLTGYYTENQQDFIQISGSSEEPVKPFSEIVNRRSLEKGRGYVFYKTEIEEITTDVAVLRYVWQSKNFGPKVFRTHEFMISSEGKLRFLVITAPLSIWDVNKKGLDEIIANVEF